MESANTLDAYLSSLVIRDKNALNFLRGMLSSAITDNDSVTISFEKEDGTSEVFNVASISNLMQRIKNLESNVTQMANIDNLSNATLVFPDGGIRTILASEQFVEPQPFEVGTIVGSYQRENALKHMLVDPYTFAKIEVPRVLYPAYNKAVVNKVIIKTADEDQLQIFNSLIKGKNFPYADLISFLNTNSLSYTEAKMNLDISAGVFRRIGKFSVLDIRRKAEVINGTDASDTSIVYLFDKLFYKNVEDGSDIFLKVGDSLNIGDNSVYNVNFVSKSTGYVGLTLMKGFEPVTLGTDNIKYFGDQEEPTVDVPLSPDELVVVFVKPVNSSKLIEANDWGTGFAYSSNELIDNKLVANLFQSLQAVANENIKPATDFIKPSQPILLQENFAVVNINKHKSNANSVVEIKGKFSQKTKAESELKLLQDSLQKAQSEKSIKKSDDFSGKKAVENKISQLLNDISNKSKEIESLGNELTAISSAVGSFRPKYEIHGFIVEPPYPKKDGITQTVIGYDTEYRYLSVDEVVDENKSFDLKDGKLSKKAVIPKWIKMPSPKLKEKTITGEWVDDSLADVDKLSTTQVTIPISKNEIVEIRTRAISEVGYPFQMNYSEWSETIKVSFPQEIDDDAESILNIAQVSAMYTKMYEKLTELGLVNHNADSALVGDKYYTHFLRTLGTDKLTPEGKPVDAQTVINSIESDILAVKNIVGSLSGTLRVRLLAQDESVLGEISNNTTFKHLDTYYKTLIENETVKKGTVVNRLFYIEVSNVGDGDIEVMPYLTGISTDRLVSSYAGYVFNNNEYENFRQYFGSPISRLGLIEDADFLASKSVANPIQELEYFQSSQVKGQTVYSRYRDITLNNDLYQSNPNGSLTPIFSGSSPQSFIWNGSQTISPTVSGNGGETDFCVHIDHPLLKVSSDFMQNWSLYYSTGAERTLPKQTYDATKAYYPPFVQTQLATDQSSMQQLAYNIYTSAISNATIGNFPSKTAFVDDDRYLIGKNTCGLYLTLGYSPDLFLNELFVNQGKVLKKGERMLVPVLASSRLTDYYGAGNTGIGRIGGLPNITNVAYTKKIGIDILVKQSKLELQKLMSFDFQYTMQYEKSSLS